MALTSFVLIPFVIVIFLCAIFAAWWLISKAGSSPSAQGELQRPVKWTQTRALWSSGLFSGLTSIAGIVVAGLIITGIFSMLPTSDDPGSASGIGMAIGMLLCGFGGIWIIASSIFGAWLHRRSAGSTSIPMGLLIGSINGGLVGITFIIYSSLLDGFSLSYLLFTLVPSVIGGFFGGVLFQRNREKAI